MAAGVQVLGGTSGGRLGGGGLCRNLGVSGNQDTGSAPDPCLCELEQVTAPLWLSISFRKGVTIHKALGPTPGTKEVLPTCFRLKSLLKANCGPVSKAQCTNEERARAVEPVGEGAAPEWAVAPGVRPGEGARVAEGSAGAPTV